MKKYFEYKDKGTGEDKVFYRPVFTSEEKGIIKRYLAPLMVKLCYEAQEKLRLFQEGAETSVSDEFSAGFIKGMKKILVDITQDHTTMMQEEE